MCGFKWVVTVCGPDKLALPVSYSFSSQRAAMAQMEREHREHRAVIIERVEVSTEVRQ